MGRFISGNEAGVDKRLISIIRAAAEASPYTVKITSGKRDYNPKTGTVNHPGGFATDVQLSSDGGHTWHSQARTKAAAPPYQDFARYARAVQTSKYPELTGFFRWGGMFGGRWSQDNEHFDITPKFKGAMSRGTWDTIIAGHPVPPADIPNRPATADELIAGRGAPNAALGYADTGVPGGPPTLRKGATDARTGGAVTRLQQQLAAVPGGPPVAVDGKYGPQTEAAVRAVEKKYGLTQERPGKAAAGPQVQAALAGNERMRTVMDTQQRFGGPLAPGGFPSILGSPPPMGIGRDSPAVSPVPIAQNAPLVMPRPQWPVVTVPPDPNAPPLVPPEQAVVTPHSLQTGVARGAPRPAPPVAPGGPPAPPQDPGGYPTAWGVQPGAIGPPPVFGRAAGDVMRRTLEGGTEGALGALDTGPKPVFGRAAGDVMRRTLEGGTEGALGTLPPRTSVPQGFAPSPPPAAGVGAGGINNFGDIADAWRRIGGDVAGLFGGPPTSTATPQSSVPQGLAPIPPAVPESASPAPSEYNRWGRQISGGPAFAPTSLGGDLSRLGTPGERAEDVPGEAVGGLGAPTDVLRGGGAYDPLSSAYVPIAPAGDRTIAPAGAVFGDMPQGVAGGFGAFDAAAEAAPGAPPLGVPSAQQAAKGALMGSMVHPRTLTQKLASGAISAAGNAFVPGLGLLLGAIARSVQGGGLDNAQPYTGGPVVNGGYERAGTTSWGSPQYYTGSSYSNSMFTPSGAGWTAPNFNTSSGGNLYAYQPNGQGGGQYVDSQGRVHSY